MGFFGVATWNPGIRVSRGSLGRSSIDSQPDIPSSASISRAGSREYKTHLYGKVSLSRVIYLKSFNIIGGGGGGGGGLTPITLI